MPRVKGKYGKKIVIKICQTPFLIIKQSRCKPVYRYAVHFGEWNKENISFLWIHLELSREKLDSYNFLHKIVIICLSNTKSGDCWNCEKRTIQPKIVRRNSNKTEVNSQGCRLFRKFQKMLLYSSWHFPETSNWKRHLLAKHADGAGSRGIPLHQICCFIDNHSQSLSVT